MARQYAKCQVSRVPYCCGAIEAGNFSIDNVSVLRHHAYSYVIGEGNTKKEAAAALFEKLTNRKTSVQFWFKRTCKARGYSATISEMEQKKYNKYFVAKELRDILLEKGGVEVARYINPNTYNELSGIIYTNNTVKVKENKVNE